MNFLPAHVPLALRAWLPLGLAAFVPLALIAAIAPFSRRRARAIATVLALRTVALLGLGFAALIAVATVSVVQTGLRELRQRHESDVRGLAQEIERVPAGLLAVEAQLRFTLFRAKDASVAFVAVGTDGCGASCVISPVDRQLTVSEVKHRLAAAWPDRSGREITISMAGKSYLLVAAPLIEGNTDRGLVVAGIQADYLVTQATRTAWVLLALSYALLCLVGWSSWQQLDSSLGSRIHAITAQIRKGSADEPIETLQIDGQELRELADSVSSYIKATLDAQKSSDERYRRLVELAPDGVIMCSKASIKFANSAALALSGAKSRYDVVGVPIEQFLEFEPGHEKSLKSLPRPARWKRIDGTVLHVEVAEIADAGEGTAQYLVRDVTDRHHREAALAHRAEHDSLTGLVNRARFESRLVELVHPGSANARLGTSRQIAVLFIDLDGFKPVNDRYGHAAGDAVLVAVADRLRDSTRGSDLIARLGGDEFAVLLEVRDHAEVTAVSDRILSSLEQAIVYDGQELHVGASIGIADTHVGGEERALTAAELLHAADLAMYSAKQSGGNRAAA
jgi:diguanylate cyclase (GGDEF)-like protein/PAS domain S-box-containing protein